MNTTELKNNLTDIYNENPDTLLAEICHQVLQIENENPLTYLKEIYGNKGLRYGLDDQFFMSFMDDITSAIRENIDLAGELVSIDQYVNEASWFAYQITLQKLLLDLELLKKDDALF